MVRETRTFQLVNYELPNGVKTDASNDIASGKKEVKTVNNKKIKECNNRDLQFKKVMTFYYKNLQRDIIDSPFTYELISQCYQEYGSDLLLATMESEARADAIGVKYMERVP